MNPYIVGGGAAIIVVMGLLLKGSYERNGELEAKLDDQVQETNECVAANETNDETITQLESRIETLSTLRAAEAEERERVLTEREEELARARARADRLEREREDEIATNDDCAALMQLDLDSFCPATAHQLRQRSIGASGDGDEGS